MQVQVFSPHVSESHGKDAVPPAIEEDCASGGFCWVGCGAMALLAILVIVTVAIFKLRN